MSVDNVQVTREVTQKPPTVLKQFLVDFVAGAAGGTACVYCGQPLDTIKVKMQTFPTYYKGFYDCFKRTLHTDGLRGLYKGSVPALLCNVAENAVLFVAFGFSKKLVATISGNNVERLSNIQTACSGSIASIFSAMVVCPTELIKCRLQALTELSSTKKTINKNITPWGVARNIVKQGGILSMFEGLTSTWARELPGYFLFFFGYELTRSTLTKLSHAKSKDDLGPLSLMFAGGTAGVFLWVGVFPLDTVKSRIQVLSMAGKQQGFFSTFANILRYEGIRKMYSGLGACILRSYPANGALFLTYEWTRKELHAFNLD